MVDLLVVLTVAQMVVMKVVKRVVKMADLKVAQ